MLTAFSITSLEVQTGLEVSLLGTPSGNSLLKMVKVLVTSVPSAVSALTTALKVNVRLSPGARVASFQTTAPSSSAAPSEPLVKLRAALSGSRMTTLVRGTE